MKFGTTIQLGIARGPSGLRQILLSAAALSLTVLSGNAVAETADSGSQASSEPTGLKEVLVTARRKDERLQDVPVAVAAISAVQLTEQRILSEADLQLSTPGLTVRQTASNNQLNFALRGQSIDAFSGTAPAVAVYLNEVQVQGNGTSSFFDLDSIQVLKGPQGTLFGRNATGGAVLYQVAQPTHKLGGFLTGGVGNFKNVEVNGAINLPVNDAVAVRLGASYHKRDGFQRNLALGGLKSNEIDYKVFRASLLIEPAGGFRNLTTVQYGQDEGIASGLKLSRVNKIGELGPDGTPLNPTVDAVYGAGAAANLAKNNAAGFYDFYNSESNFHKSRQIFASNKASYQFSNGMTLSNIFGLNDLKAHDVIDVDGSDFPWIIIANPPASQVAIPGPALPDQEGYHWTTKQWSDETQLSGKAMDEKLNYIFGIYFSNVKTGTNTPTCAFCDIPSQALGLPNPGWGNQGRFNAEREGKSKAVFAQATYKLTDQLSLTGGYRHTWETQSITRLALDTQATGNSELKANKPSWTVSLDYKPTDALLLYAATRGSFRTPGYNVDNFVFAEDGVTHLNNAYKTETTNDIEVGAKFAGDLGGVPAHINLAIYNQKVRDIQRAIYLGISSVTGNVNKARIRGFEFDSDFDLADWLQVGLSAAYTKADYTDPNATAAGQSFKYGPYGDTPKTTGSAFAKFSKDLGHTGSAFLRAEVYRQSSFFYSNLAGSVTVGTEIDAYTLVNLRAGLDNIAGTRFSVMAYGQNITDKEYQVGGLDLGAVIGTSARLAGVPRTFGIQGTYKF
jgi:iron complex outermembrane recepter protein